MIDTKQVKDRRPLRFASLDEVVRDAESLADAQRRDALRSTGNWSLGQAVGHLAFWARAPFAGYPGMGRAPWLVRFIVSFSKNRFLNKGLPAGARIPRVPAGTFGVEPLATAQALDELRTEFGRLTTEAPDVPNMIFGVMTHEEWIKLNLRHSELHLSFFHLQ